MKRFFTDACHSFTDHNIGDRYFPVFPRCIAHIIIGHLALAGDRQRTRAVKRPCKILSAGTADHVYGCSAKRSKGAAVFFGISLRSRTCIAANSTAIRNIIRMAVWIVVV